MTKITSRIIGHKDVVWRDLKWLQTDELKELTPENMKKLKASLRANRFVMPFIIWEREKETIILDGVHRKLAMEELEREGAVIPEVLPALSVRCKNRREAAKLVLLYSSNYAQLSARGLKEFVELENLVLDEITQEVDVSALNLDLLNQAGFEGKEELTMDENVQKGLSDVYVVVGEFRLKLERDEYLRWMEELKVEVGFDKQTVMKEIKRRLGL